MARSIWASSPLPLLPFPYLRISSLLGLGWFELASTPSKLASLYLLCPFHSIPASHGYLKGGCCCRGAAATPASVHMAIQFVRLNQHPQHLLLSKNSANSLHPLDHTSRPLSWDSSSSATRVHISPSRASAQEASSRSWSASSTKPTSFCTAYSARRVFLAAVSSTRLDHDGHWWLVRRDTQCTQGLYGMSISTLNSSFTIIVELGLTLGYA